MSLGQGILVVIVYVLAVMRLTRLINGDSILDPPRDWIATKSHRARQEMLAANRSGQKSAGAIFAKQSQRWAKLLYFVECPWCVSIWIAGATAWLPLYFHDNRVVQYVGIVLAASHLVGVFAFAADTEETDVEETP